MATLTLTNGVPQTVRTKQISSVTEILVHSVATNTVPVQVYFPALDGESKPTNVIIPSISAYPSNYRVVRPGQSVVFKSSINTLTEIVLESIGGNATVDVFDVATHRL